jgi:nicotinate-nucleotide--dimethylbenzimidazole phosphoribosyltransferase
MTDTSLDLDSLSGLVELPDEGARVRLREHLLAVAGSPGSLGRLEELAVWLAGAQGESPVRPVRRARAVLFAGDHGIAEADVSVRRQGDTAKAVRELLDGTGAAQLLAEVSGAAVRVVDVSVDAEPFPGDVSDHRVRRSSGRIDLGDAITFAEAEQAFAAGMAVADAEVDAGTDLLLAGNLGVGDTTPAAVLIGALTGMDAAAVIGRGSGIDDAAWIRKCAAIRDALRRARPQLGDPMRLLATSGGADFAALAGFLLQASVRRTPVVLDSLPAVAAGLVVQRIAYRAPDWWLAGHVTPEPGHVKALDRMALVPLLDYQVRYGQGVGALLALPLLKAAAALAAGLPEPRVPLAKG